MRIQFFIALFLLKTYESYPIQLTTINNSTDYCNCTYYCDNYQTTSTLTSSSYKSIFTTTETTSMPYSDVSFAVTCKFNLTYLADFKDLNSNASRAFISNYKDLVKDLIFKL